MRGSPEEWRSGAECSSRSRSWRRGLGGWQRARWEGRDPCRDWRRSHSRWTMGRGPTWLEPSPSSFPSLEFPPSPHAWMTCQPSSHPGPSWVGHMLQRLARLRSGVWGPCPRRHTKQETAADPFVDHKYHLNKKATVLPGPSREHVRSLPARA